MKTAKSIYLGDLRISSTHIKSGTIIETDAPLDNQGKGTRFSPTDLMATAYMNCMITIIGIYCNNHNLSFTHCEGEMEKIMGSNPRRISQLNITLDLTGNDWSKEDQKKVEAAARACPVAKSVSTDLIANIEFIF